MSFFFFFQPNTASDLSYGLVGSEMCIRARVCNTALRPLGKLIDRLPVSDQAAEARYQVAVTVPEPAVAEAREALGKALSAGGFPVAGWEQHARQDLARIHT